MDMFCESLEPAWMFCVYVTVNCMYIAQVALAAKILYISFDNVNREN